MVNGWVPGIRDCIERQNDKERDTAHALLPALLASLFRPVAGTPTLLKDGVSALYSR